MKDFKLVTKAVVSVVLFCALESAFAQYGIMPLSREKLLQWQAEREATPDYALPSGYVGLPREVNLLTNLNYDARLRDQGRTGSCWMWGCQAVLSLDYARQFPARALALTNGFSVQFISSYLHTIDGELNMGGTPQMFRRFFTGFGYAVPWSNTNAAWTDYKGYVVRRPAEIYTQPNAPIGSMALQDLNTFTASTNDAIALIKSVLDSGRALHFNLTLADGDEWDKFMSFWGKTEATEETIFTSFVSGKTLNMATGGAHMMACVGYNDTDTDPSKHYWLILNSWSTGNDAEDTRRPHGTWRLPMNLDYGSYTQDGMSGIKAPMFSWGILDTVFADKVQKDVDVDALKLHASDPDQTQISLRGPITVPGVIGEVKAVSLYINDRFYRCVPQNGTWKQGSVQEGVPPSGDILEYTSNPGQEPSISLQLQLAAKRWSCALTRLTADDCRFIDLHRGLYFHMEYAPSEDASPTTLCSEKSIAYDELTELSQNSGEFRSGAKDASLTFTLPQPSAAIAVGSTCVITWTNQGLENRLISLELDGFGKNRDKTITIADLIPAEAGRYEWRVPNDILLVTNKTLSAVTAADSPQRFEGPSISLVPSSAPQFVVRAPAGGEEWTTNTTHLLSWEGYNLSGNVTIELLHNGSVVPGATATVAAASGRMSFTLPPALVEGTYEIRFTTSGLSVTSAPIVVQNTPKAKKPWTMLVYFDADNNLESSQMIDFLNLAKVGSSSNINVLVQMDRTPGYYIGYDNWYGAKRYFMTNGITPTIANAAQDLGEVSIGRPETLTDFINWGVENYPADRYLLVMADHGDGWEGALWDVTPNALGMVPQPMTTFQQAISNAVAPMTIVGFDCCLMASIESAYQLRNCGAEVYIGSQYMETKGWAYPEILLEIERTKGQIDTRALAARICDLSVAVYDPKNPAAQSAIDLRKMDPLAASIAEFTQAMITGPNNRSLIEQKADGVASSYHQAVIHTAANQQTERLTTGLNIFFPLRATSSAYAAETLDFKADANWQAFLQAYTNTLVNTWIGETRQLLGTDDEVDLMRFVNGIHPPDDTVWVSFTVAGRGVIEGVPSDVNLLFHRGDVIPIAGNGFPKQGELAATHFVRWWASDGVTFSNALTEATNWVTVTDHASVIAYFSDSQDEYKVTFLPMGNGFLNGQREPFELTVHRGANAPAVLAVPDQGFTFAGWGGDAAGSANPLVISNVISDMTVYGMFFAVKENWLAYADTTWWQAGVSNVTLSTPRQLAGLAKLVNEGVDSFAGKVVSLGADLDLSGKQWTAVGSGARPFAGSFNGQGYTINGVTIEQTSEADYQGLFGIVSSAGSIVIENLYLTNTTIVGGGLVGGLAGQIVSEEGSVLVRHCSNHGSVWGYGGLVGGIIGELGTSEGGRSATISNCVNRARVNGAASTGGVLGRVLVGSGDALVTHCENQGSVTGDAVEIGGVVGMAASDSASASVEHCVNSGTVTADADYVGGIAGKMGGGTVTLEKCRNGGNVTVTGAGHERVGGVVGSLSGMMTKLANSSNAGDIHGNNFVGGVAGFTAVSMQNCANEGRVQGGDRVGGLAGAVQGSGSASIESGMNAGEVVGTSRVGGIVGQIASENSSYATAAYFLKTPSVNSGLAFAGEMIPSSVLTGCATFAAPDGHLSTNGYANKTILVNALNAWVNDNPGSGCYYWSTNRAGIVVYPYLDPTLSEVVVTFRANGGVFTGGLLSTNKTFALGQPYASLPDKPTKPNHAFVGWWYIPDPASDPAKLTPDVSASPSVTVVDAYWSTTTKTKTPLPISVETLALYYPQVAMMNEDQINALANQLAANNRDKVWELIYLGLNPADPKTVPGAVSTYLTLNPVRVHTVPEKPLSGITGYIVQGKKTLTDPTWTNLGNDIPDDYHFFRVMGY